MTVANQDRLDRQLNDYDIVWAVDKSKNLEIACIKKITVTPKFWGPPTALPPQPIDKWLLVFFNRGYITNITYSEIFNNSKTIPTFRTMRVDYNRHYSNHLNALLIEDPRILNSQAIHALKEHTRKQRK